MACRTFLWSGPDLLVAIDALGVKCICFLQDFNAFVITRIMAVLAEFRLSAGAVLFGQMAVTAGSVSGILSGRMMMTVVAGCAIARSGCMGSVIKQNFPGNPLEHDPDGVFRLSGGKSSIAEGADNKQNNGRTVSYLQVFL